MGKTVFFGGTFNPPHIAHRKLLEAVCGLVDVEKVLVAPTNIPPHKETPKMFATKEQRLKMQIKVPYGMEGVLRIPVRVCQALYVNNVNGEMVKTRRNGDYIRAKLFVGEWIACSDVSFGERV